MAVNPNIEFQIGPQIVLIKAPLTSVTNQDIWDTANDFLDAPNAPAGVSNFVFADGVVELTSGFTDLTLTVVDWKIQFEDRAGPDLTECAVLGNVVGRTGSQFGTPQIVIAPSDFVFARIVESTSAGLQKVGSGLSTSEQERLERIEKFLRNRQVTNPVTGKLEVYNDAGDAVEFEGEIYSTPDTSTPYDGTEGIERRERLETP